ncbi:pntB [Symbiodinium natans]|uniref:proton-translocating NAD(P)(+) transhydrogenase n=1 Tax=Symbiodinium natans TaxID=878477 RepID=A0A812GVT5_9DINO|nr:pntB [Symbiodinium natans]
MQLQAVQGIQSSAVKALAKNGAEELLQALPVGVDCGNLLACVVEAGLGILADASEASGETEALVLGVLRDAVTLRCYAAPLSAAVLQAYMAAIAGISSAKERKRITKVYQEPVQLLGDTVPAALAEAFRWTVDQALALEVDAEPLVNLLAPACAAVPDDGDASEKLVPAVQAFHHKSAKVRSRAVQKAVAELAELPEKGGEGAQERCRLMASLALQVVNDENAEVVAVALKQEALWTSGEVAPSMATSVLSTALRRLLRGVQPKGKNLQELFRSLLQEDSRVRALFPLMIQASAWIYGREDTEQDERKRLDALLLPVLLLAFSGLDAAEEAAGPLQRLEAAAAEFCKVSEEPLLKVPAGGAEAGEAWGARIGAVAQAADAEAAGRLADLAAEESILGGLGSQTAAALALAASLPRLQKKAPQLVTRGATACQRLARLSDSAELRTLWKACVEAAAPGPSGPVRRKSGKSSTASGAGEAPARVLLEVALQRPKVFAADLQLSLQNHAAALRPALLQLALGSGGMEGSPAITANALLLLRSLLASWGADQMMLVLILARLASAEERQVRAAAVALLETLQEVKIAQESGIDALVEERLLLPTASVVPEKVWPSLGQQLPATLWSTLLERILKQKAELVQDPIAAQNVLQKLLGLKGGLPKTSREQACSFWLVGLARLAPDQAALLTALPGALALRSVQEPLAKTAQWAAKSTTAPALLLAAMSLLLHMAGGAMLSAAEKIRTAAQEAAVEALRQVALPFCLGLAEVCEKAQEAPAWDSSLVHLASRTCAALSKVAGALAAQSVHEEVVAESLKTLFRFSVAVRGLAPAADESGFSSVVATASSALSEAPAKPWLVERLLQGSEFQGKRLKAARGEVAAEILCEQVASLEASLGEDAAALLRKLGEVVKEVMQRWLRADPASSCSRKPAEQLLVTLRREQGIEVKSRRSCVSFGRMTLSATALGDAISLPRFRETYLYRCYERNVHSSDVLTSSGLLDDDEGLDLSQIRVQSVPQQLSLCIPACPSVLPVLNAWASTAMKSLAGLAGGLPLVQALQALGGGGGAALDMPLKLGGVGSIDAFLEESEKSLATHVGLFSLTSAVMFIGSIKGLNKHSTAREGNYMGMVATALGILSVLLSPGFHSAHIRFFLTFLAAGGVGYGIASTVKMEDMPQLVAGFHSFVGLAAVFAGFASYCNIANPYTAMKALETVVGIAIGSLTFTGSVVAAGKLHEVIPGKPIILPQRWLLNGGALAGSIVLTALFLNPATYASHAGSALLLANTAIWGFLGVNMVLPIGGADMPVVVSLLNAFSGLATSAAGFMLSNDLLTISGALIASSGTLLSDIMCRGINRSMYNVLLGGFGTDSTSAATAAAAGGRENVSEVSAVGFVGMLFGAKKVVIVPGYGLAVARCQQKLAEIVAMLRKHNVIVHFAIHPVAGRMPGHMNVLLAEADVPYDIVKEMDEINAELPTYDVGIVVGANDIVNPATQDDPSSPIYGMPAIEIWKCKQCVVLKRSMGTGYSGVDNPLFYLSNVKMLFGDAKQSMDSISSCLEDSHDRFTAAAGASSSGDQHDATQGVEPEVFPEATRVIGIVRERLPGEARVSFAPSAVVKLRRMGFSILLEAGSGTAAGFTDEEYTRHGGVQVAESSVEVLKQADIIFKVTEPLLDEVQMLQGTQTMVGFWNMYGTQELLAALAQTSASVVNLALVPRVSRAQKLDALTSMANIAGYRAILDAFARFPRFSRAGSTAFGSVPPAKVFVIGAGVAGLSAIATAHSLGCKVFANDVRDAAREQVESMGAQFIAVDAQGIAGEGAGGYATVMGEDFTRAQLATYARVIPDMDVIVTTAMIPNRAAPELITSEMVATMRKGSVIVDLAAQTGGNCVYTEPNKAVVTPNGVTVVGETNYASQMASQSSEMLGSNFAALLEVLGSAENFGGEHWDDPVVKPAIVARGGAVVWDPNPPRPPAPPVGSAVEANVGGFGGASPVPPPVPAEANAVVAWIQEHKDELALGVGGAVVLGLGLAVDIPEAEVTHLGYFVLSCLIGNFTVAGVTPALHTPLISVTNAISGIIVVGGMLQLSGPVLSARVACALAAVFLSSVNIVGGFAVTARMLDMFREDANPKKALAERS